MPSSNPFIDLYAWKSPNADIILIMLEEVGLAYRLVLLDKAMEEAPIRAFSTINPNIKVPAILDQEGPEKRPYAVSESSAILIYLAEKTGRLLPTNPSDQALVMQWLMFAIAGIGSMFRECAYFRRVAGEKVPYAIDRYSKESGRLYNVLDQQLVQKDYVAGDYSIADIALWPWARNPAFVAQDPEEFPYVMRWVKRMESRGAIQRARRILGRWE